MFKCDYDFNGECQLFNKFCHGTDNECKCYLQCHSCRYKLYSKKSKACTECFAHHKKEES